MTFRNKILLSIWGVVLSLLVITFFVITYWTRSRIEGTLTDELRAGLSTVEVHEQLQSSQLIRACVVIAESPRLRAVAELGDARTAAQLLKELSPTTESQIFLLTDRDGRPLVQLLRGVSASWDVSHAATIDDARHRTPSADVWSVQGAVYRVVTVPMLVQADLVGTLTLGFEITGSDLQRLKKATNCELLLIDDGSALVSTLSTAATQMLLSSAIRQESPGQAPERSAADSSVTMMLRAGDETYLGMRYLLGRSPSPEAASASYAIVRSLTAEVRKATSPILGTFAIVSLIFLALTTVIGLVISRGMTRPIEELVTGTTEIARGNYDYPIRVRGRDELSYLARRFMEMSASLKAQIAELGRLNSDLLARNRDLDETLRKLRTAQDDLMRSERLATAGRMTAQLAHEINNPIHNIQSLLKTALTRLPAEARGRDLIEVAYDEVNRLSRLTVQMLAFYRGSLVEDEMKPVNIADLVREVIALSTEQLAAGRIALASDIGTDLPSVLGSRDKLKQVLLNLISNARDAMPEGGRLTITATARDGAVRTAVTDTGVGIAPENLARIFDAFYTTKGKVSGVGLGLSVSYGIISQHRGSIEVQSRPGHGSAFTVVLPAAPDGLASPHERTPPDTPEEHP